MVHHTYPIGMYHFCQSVVNTKNKYLSISTHLFWSESQKKNWIATQRCRWSKIAAKMALVIKSFLICLRCNILYDSCIYIELQLTIKTIYYPSYVMHFNSRFILSIVLLKKKNNATFCLSLECSVCLDKITIFIDFRNVGGILNENTHTHNMVLDSSETIWSVYTDKQKKNQSFGCIHRTYTNMIWLFL